MMVGEISVDQMSALLAQQAKKNPPPPARELTVDEGGTGENCFGTLAEAVLAAKDGDSILLKPGQYPLRRPVVVSRRVTIRGTGARAETKIFLEEGQGAASGSAQAALTLEGPTGGALQNVTLQGTAAGGGLLVRSGPWEIKNCVIQGDTGRALPAVQLGDTARRLKEGEVGCTAKVSRCEIYGGSWGVQISPGAGRQVEKCHLHDCSEGGIAYRSAALNCFIDSNVLHDIQGPAILVDDEATGDVEGNRFWACDGVAVSAKCRASVVGNMRYKREPAGGAAALLPGEDGAPRKKLPVGVEDGEEKDKPGCGSFYSFFRLVCQTGGGGDDH